MKTVQKLIMDLVLVSLMLTACSNSGERAEVLAAPPAPVTVSSMRQSQPEPEKAGAFQTFADELRDIYAEELIELLNEWLDEHKNGSFEEIPNHHPTYPADFPPASSLPNIQSVDEVAIAWRETQQTGENSERPGRVFVLVPIGENHVYILEPAKFCDANNNISIGFGYSGFENVSVKDFVAQSETSLVE